MFFFRNIGGIYFDRYRFTKIIGSILNGSNFLWILENNIRQFLRSDYEDVLLLMTHFLRGIEFATWQPTARPATAAWRCPSRWPQL